MSNVDSSLVPDSKSGRREQVGEDGQPSETAPSVQTDLSRQRIPPLPVVEQSSISAWISETWRQVCSWGQKGPVVPTLKSAGSLVLDEDPAVSADVARSRPAGPPKHAFPTPTVAPEDLGDVTKDARSVPVNHRLLIASAIVVVLGLSAIHGVHALQLSRLSRQSRELGIQAREAGDTSAAIAHLRRYLEIAPDDIEAIEGLAFSVADTADTTRAKYEATLLFERMLRDSPGSTVARRKLVDLLIWGGEYSSAIDHLRELISRDPKNSALLALLGTTLERTDHFDQAAKAYQQACAAAPLELEHFRNLARVLHVHLDQPAAAAEVLNNLILSNPSSPEGYLTRARFQFDQGNLRKARIDGVRAWRLAPDDVDVCVLMVDLFTEAPWPGCPVRLDDLKRTLSAAATDDPQDPATLALVHLQLKAGEYEQAEAEIQSILKSDPESEMAQLLSTDILTMKGDVDAAREANEQLESRLGRRGYLSDFLEARTEFKAENWQTASPLFQRVFDHHAAPLTLRTQSGLLLAECWDKMGHVVRRHNTYAEIVRLNPDSAEAVRALADSYRDSGNDEEAIQQYLRLKDDPQAALAAAEVIIRQNHRLPASRQRWKDVEAAVNHAIDTASDPVIGPLLNADVLHAQGKPAAAANLLQNTLQSHPGDRRLWLSLFRIYESLQDWDAAESALSQLDALTESADTTLGLRIQLAAAAGRREILDELSTKVDRLADAQRLELTRSLAMAWGTLGELNKSDECWAVVASSVPQDLQVLRARFALASLQGDDDRSRELIEQMREIEGEFGEYWQLSEARRLYVRAQRGRRDELPEARRILESLDGRVPDRGQLMTMLGDVCQLEGDVEAAIDYYRTTVNQHRPSQHCVVQLAHLLYQRGEYADVGRLIRRFEQSTRDGLTPQLAQLGTQASFQADEAAEALRFAQIRTDTAADTLESQIWLGQVQRLAGRSDAAETHFRRAVELEPAQPGGWIALVALLADSGRTDDVVDAIAAAREAVPDSLRDLTLAQCFEVAGEDDAAAAHYQQLNTNGITDVRQLEATVRFYVRTEADAQAIEILRSLTDGKESGDQTLVVQARRLLAELKSNSGRYPDRLAAVQLIDENLDNTDTGQRDRDLLLKARLLASSSVRAEQREAARLYDELRSRSSLSIRDTIELARLHAALDNMETAKQQARRLVARAPKDPQILRIAIGLMLDAGASDDILVDWLGRLQALRPDDLQTVVLSSRWLISGGRVDEALAGLDKAAETQQKSQLAAAVDQMGRNLDRAGHVEFAEDFVGFAEELYRRAAADDPVRQLDLARFLLRWWRVDEALQTCHELRGRVPDEHLAGMYTRVLRTRRLSPADAGEVRQWLTGCCHAAPDSWRLTLAQAHALALNQEYSEAIAAYLRVLELDPDNVEALNEAAVLLALTNQDPRKAAELIERAIQNAGPLGVLMDSRASVQLALGAPEDAVLSAQSAIAEGPSSVRYLHLAQAQFAVGQKELSRETLQTAFSMRLHENVIHPLERPAFEQLRSDLNL